MGAIILSAPGSGKTTWLKNNVDYNNEWLDADKWASDLKLHTKEWHSFSHTYFEEKKHYQFIDKALVTDRLNGKKILGSLFWEIKPDAIVNIDHEEHRRRVAHRRDLNWNNVLRIKTTLNVIGNKNSIPFFSNFTDAIQYCNKL